MKSDPVAQTFVPLVSFNPNDGNVEWWTGGYTPQSNDGSGDSSSSTLTDSTAQASDSTFRQDTTLSDGGFTKPGAKRLVL